jgi:hypothetical protein
MATTKPELSFNIVLGDRKIPINLESALKIDVNNIDEELVEQPSHYAWYCAIYEYAAHYHQQLKTQGQKLEAELTEGIRYRAAASGTRITEKIMDAQLKSCPEWIEFQDLINEAQKNVNLARVAKDAFQQRRDMLVSLVSLVREERQWSSSSKILKDKTVSGFVR